MNLNLLQKASMMLLLAIMPTAALAQYYTPETQQSTGMSYADMMAGKKETKTRPRDKYYQVMTEKRHIQRVDRSEMKAVFIPKGLWMTGVSANYREWDNDNDNFLVLKNLNMEGHVFSVSPALGYFVANNLAIGVRYDYSRNYLYLKSLDLNLGEDFNINLDDLYYLQHQHTGSFFLRYYMPLFGSKIFGAFADTRLSYTRSTSKNSTGRVEYPDDPNKPAVDNLEGTFGHTNEVSLGVSPGISVFATDFMAVETSIGVLGVNYRWSEYRNRRPTVEPDEPLYQDGKSHSGGAKFKFNLFSINLGITFYL